MLSYSARPIILFQLGPTSKVLWLYPSPSHYLKYSNCKLRNRRMEIVGNNFLTVLNSILYYLLQRRMWTMKLPSTQKNGSGREWRTLASSTSQQKPQTILAVIICIQQLVTRTIWHQKWKFLKETLPQGPQQSKEFNFYAPSTWFRNEEPTEIFKMVVGIVC